MRRLIGGLLAFVALGFCLCLALPLVSKVRMRANRVTCANNMHQLGMALHNYHDTFKSFPPGTIPNEALSPEQRLSWIIALFPYLEHDHDYRKIDMKKAWDSPENSLI